MTELDLPEGSLAGLVAWYSIIHTPTPELSGLLARFRHALAPGGWLVLAFQTGEGVRHVDLAYGHPLSLDLHLRRTDELTRLLAELGLTVHAVLERQAEEREGGPRAFVLARRPLDIP
jgi:hypothetical protein